VCGVIHNRKVSQLRCTKLVRVCVCVCGGGDQSGLQYLNMWNSHLEPSDSLGELLYQPNVLDVWRDLSSICLQRLRERMSQERY